MTLSSALELFVENIVDHECGLPSLAPSSQIALSDEPYSEASFKI